ncbi:WecB/TagA/CpsF family glycosyltransferase [Carnobacterium inhibens]|uniref:WecB/TagA/CpsF family glycosyltransferase n=1 Tax=Carnobacterium inhibens TaxID=147709 RepID=UPI001EE35E61|nr:WecB/TagA/CpsF family glycosyltransferase [Carnobacterium inhibens]
MAESNKHIYTKNFINEKKHGQEKHSDIKKFVRKVDKSRIPTINILGVSIAAVDIKWTTSYLEKNLTKLSGDYICVSNVHTTVLSYEDESYLNIQNNGLMALPDGGPLSTIGRRAGFPDMERVTGPTLMNEMLKISVDKEYRHFFYGSTEETLEIMKKNLQTHYPGLQVSGMYSPPFRPLIDDEKKDIIKMINETNPDFIWVGLGAPKQENWMAEHQGKVSGLMIGVGAAFDYLAGNIKRAPRWMQNYNLEWFYRLIQDPKRLFSRYLKTNVKFLFLISHIKESKEI